MKKAIIFDFDDTLVDFSKTRALICDFLNDYCKKKYGITNFGSVMDELDTEMTIYARIKKDPRIDNRAIWAKVTAKRMGVKLSERQAQEIRKIYWKLALIKTKLLPGAKEVLTKLSKKYNLYVLSDADGETAQEKINRIKKVRIYKYFKGNVFGDAIGTTKPDLKFYAYLIKKYGIDPKNSVMIGDKPQYDLILAKRLGMKTIWIKHGVWADMMKNKKFKYVDYAIKDLKGLLRIIRCD